MQLQKGEKGSRLFSKANLKKSRVRFFNRKIAILLMIFLIGYFVLSFSSKFERLYLLQKELKNIEQQVNDLKVQNDNLRKELNIVKTDTYVEQIAREKLGLVKRGETRIVTTVNNGEKQIYHNNNSRGLDLNIRD